MVAKDVCVAGLAFIVGCQREGGPSVGGSGGVDGGNPTTGGVGSGGTAPVPELCSLGGTCTDGKFSGAFGPICVSLEVTCEYGCRNPPKPLPVYRERDGSVASRLVYEAFCEPGDGSVTPPDDARPDGSTCQPQVMNGYDTGLDTCADGTVHHRAGVFCVKQI